MMHRYCPERCKDPLTPAGPTKTLHLCWLLSVLIMIRRRSPQDHRTGRSTSCSGVLHRIRAAPGLGFTCVERLLTVGPAGRYLEATFKANKGLPASQVRPAVHQAATNLVGLLHVLIVVPLAISVLLDPKMIKDRLLLYCYGFFSQVLHYYGAMFLLWELSTPFVYARWFLHKAGMSHTTAYKINGVLMVLVFFLCRNVAGLVCSVDFFRETSPELRHPTPGGLSPAAIWLYRGLNLPLNALNAFWFYKMLTGALKVLKQAPSNSHKADGHKRS
ncbi:hypothetical protein WJX82_000224 [Trebouxia sp. C0006]